MLRVLGVSAACLLLAVACGDDDEGSKGATNGPQGPPPGVNGTCPHDVSTQPGTQLSGLTIPSGHPRIWFTPERIERAKQWQATNRFQPRDDDRMGQAFAHVVAGADCRSAIDWAKEFTVSDSEFRVASDNVRWEGERIITIYDWCFDQLSDAEKTTIRDRWNGYIDKASKLEWGGPTMPESNYYWGYLRNEMLWGIATANDNPSAPTFLEHGLVTRWEKSFLPFASGSGNGDGRGGIPREGTQYGAYMTDYPVSPFVTASLYGRAVYDETDFFKGTVFYLIAATTPAPTTSAGDSRTGYEVFPFNDDEAFQNRSSASRYANFMTQAAVNWDCLPVGKLARAWTKMIGAKADPFIASVDKGGESGDLTTLPLDFYGAGAGYYYGRNVWGATSTAFHWQLGDYTDAGVGHSHFDYGNWQIWRGGRWLSRESTAYSDDFTGFGGNGSSGASSTIAHNTLLFDGRGFADPSSNGADGPPVIRRLESQPEYAYANVDLTKSYRNSDPNHTDRDNKAVAHAEREFVFVRGLETTVIFDRVKSTSDSVTKTFLAHFEDGPTLVDANHVRYTSGSQELRIAVLVPSAPQMRVIDEKTADGNELGQFRLEVNTSGAAQSYFLTVLQAKDASGPALDPRVEDNGAAFVVTLDASTTLTFPKGEASTGGSTSIKGATKNFRADAQSMRITDAGPFWDP
jgi:hypothetical protein